MNLLQFYRDVRMASLDMVKPLEIEDYLLQPSYFASPPKWNLGHTTWFFEDMVLKKYMPDYTPFNDKFSFIFNSYYNSLGDRIRRDSRGDLSRPTVDEVLKYREYVDVKMVDLLSGSTEKFEHLVILGLNHEQQHQELFFTDLKYAFSINPLYPSYTGMAYCEDEDKNDTGFAIVKEGIYNIGYDGSGFAYDNELPQHKVFLTEFEIRHKLVTNGEFQEFIEAGGYENAELWHDEGFSRIRENNITNPMYWHKTEGKWYQYTLAGLRMINPSHILTHISYYEAYAFAQWKGMRLPSEFEWEVAASQLDYGKRWEWTESAYLPYPGYKREKGALGEYNGKFMVNQKVLRGGSVVTPKGHSRVSYRNFFHPQMGYQFNGIRLVK
ncbi:ergothioneine biosynthesis protein EgtB [Saccharicrinis sp. FJH54]|uniref:ergothioneine biosynthesis protein EgtB n=1 Tax=Saccharicrinis sp. FJH54 TaxID=3344665 RepID=UPI0035D49726